MKTIFKATIFLLIFLLSTQTSLDSKIDANGIGKLILESVIEVAEKTKTENGMESAKNEQDTILGPFEIELIQEILASLIRCKPITDRLYYSDYISFGLKPGLDIINITITLISREDFGVILDRILRKVNIFNFEVWIRLIRIFIEKFGNLPAIQEHKNYYVINYRNGDFEKIPKSYLNDDSYKNQRKAIKIYEFLNQLENFFFYYYKFYSFATFNSFNDYFERFAGTTLTNFGFEFLPINLIMKNIINWLERDDAYMENFFTDVGVAISKYSYKKLGFNYFLKLLKYFFGPIGLAIDALSFSYNFGYSFYQIVSEYFNS